jgi:hypothetical protein
MRIFEKEKSEYTFRTINSIINSIEFNKEELKSIKLKVFIIDHNSAKEDLEKIKKKLLKIHVNFEIINLDAEKFKKIKTLDKNNSIIEKNMKATMASILTSFQIAKEKCDDLIYFVEDDYIIKKRVFLKW